MEILASTIRAVAVDAQSPFLPCEPLHLLCGVFSIASCVPRSLFRERVCVLSHLAQTQLVARGLTAPNLLPTCPTRPAARPHDTNPSAA